MNYHQHVVEVCKEHNITFVERPGTERASVNRRIIWAPTPKTINTYLTALHEIGHVVNGENKVALVDEAGAWLFAIVTSKFPISGGGRSHMAKCFTSYVKRNLAIYNGARTRSGARNVNILPERHLRSDLDDPVVIALFKILGLDSEVIAKLETRVQQNIETKEQRREKDRLAAMYITPRITMRINYPGKDHNRLFHVLETRRTRILGYYLDDPKKVEWTWPASLLERV